VNTAGPHVIYFDYLQIGLVMKCFVPAIGMGEIVKRRQLIKLKRYGAVQDLGFNEMRKILRFLF
jgi:hypothetical protein